MALEKNTDVQGLHRLEFDCKDQASTAQDPILSPRLPIWALLQSTVVPWPGDRSENDHCGRPGVDEPRQVRSNQDIIMI